MSTAKTELKWSNSAVSSKPLKWKLFPTAQSLPSSYANDSGHGAEQYVNRTMLPDKRDRRKSQYQHSNQRPTPSWMVATSEPRSHNRAYSVGTGHHVTGLIEYPQQSERSSPQPFR
jgi:hypothetical protein